MKCSQTGDNVTPEVRILQNAREKRLSCPKHTCCTVEYREL